MSKLQELKLVIKKLATEIKQTKIKMKEHQRLHGGSEGPFSVLGMKHEFRHKHIAYCLLRGTERDKIEKPAEDNKPNEDYIKEIQNAYTETVENVCIG